MNTKSIKYAVAVLAIAGMALAGSLKPASATTITFEGVAPVNGSVIPVSPYTEAGFTLTDLQGGAFDGIFGAAGVANTDGTSVFGWCHFCGSVPRVIELTAVGGAAFSLNSLDASSLVGTGSGISVVALGNLVGGGTVTQTLALSNLWSTFTFSGFNALASVDFSILSASSSDAALDNLVLNTSPVPEPEAYALLALGLVLLLGVSGRRRTGSPA